MEYVSGNIFIRTPKARMKKDEVVLGHRHEFDHTTFVTRGRLEVSLITPTKVNAFDEPLDATIDKVFVLDADDEVNWQLILKGRFHILKALEDGTSYQCIYSHRTPQAVTLDRQGQLPQGPMTRRDADGLWLRVDEKIVQVTSEWADAYR